MYELENVIDKVLCGDNVYHMKKMVEKIGGSLRMIWTDPLYSIEQSIGTVWDDIVRRLYFSSIYNEDGTLKGNGKNFKKYIYGWISSSYDLLCDGGVLCVMCDDTNVHIFRTIMDEVFCGKHTGHIGEYLNTFHWWSKKSGHSDSLKGGRAVDYIIVYKKGRERHVYNQQYLAYSKEYIENNFIDLYDGNGLFQTQPLTGEALQGGGYKYTYCGIERVWTFPEEGMYELERKGLIYRGRKGTAIPRRKLYLKECKGVPITNLILHINPVSKPRYPTEKPIELVKFFIETFTNIGDVILDPHFGGGTTGLAAIESDRHFIGIDLSQHACIEAVNWLFSNGYTQYTNESILDIEWSFIRVWESGVKGKHEFADMIAKMIGATSNQRKSWDGGWDAIYPEFGSVVQIKGGKNNTSKKDLQTFIKQISDLDFGFEVPHVYVARGYKDNCQKYIDEQKEIGKTIILLTLEDILLGRFVKKYRINGLMLKNNITQEDIQEKLYGFGYSRIPLPMRENKNNESDNKGIWTDDEEIQEVKAE